MDHHVLNWDEYFTGIAMLAALRSKDPSSQVGAVITTAENKVVGMGYNGFVAGIDESKFTWNREGEWLETKYPYVVHAEANAILNSTTSDLKNCKVYVTLFPCNECAKQIAQKKISEIIYLEDKYPDSDQGKASRLILKAAGIKVRKVELPHLSEELIKVANKIDTLNNLK